MRAVCIGISDPLQCAIWRTSAAANRLKARNLQLKCDGFLNLTIGQCESAPCLLTSKRASAATGQDQVLVPRYRQPCRLTGYHRYCHHAENRPQEVGLIRRLRAASAAKVQQVAGWRCRAGGHRGPDFFGRRGGPALRLPDRVPLRAAGAGGLGGAFQHGGLPHAGGMV